MRDAAIEFVHYHIQDLNKYWVSKTLWNWAAQVVISKINKHQTDTISQIWWQWSLQVIVIQLSIQIVAFFAYFCGILPWRLFILTSKYPSVKFRRHYGIFPIEHIIGHRYGKWVMLYVRVCFSRVCGMVCTQTNWNGLRILSTWSLKSRPSLYTTMENIK